MEGGTWYFETSFWNEYKYALIPNLFLKLAGSNNIKVNAEMIFLPVSIF